MKPNILLVYGGNSVEHEISIITALQIKKNYTGKYNLILCYLKNGNFHISDKLEKLSTYKNLKEKSVMFIPNKNYIIKNRKKIMFEAIWVVTHGKDCEDGTIASYFKTLNIPCISQNVTSACIGQNKYLSKKLTGVTSLNSVYIDNNTYNNNLTYLINKANEFKYPIILKPNNLGSSVGVNIIYDNSSLVSKLEELLLLDDSVIMEKCLDNFIELNIALLKYKNEIIVSEIEKVSDSKVLSYNDKYINDNKSLSGSINKELPAKINKTLTKNIIESAKQIYTDLNMSLVVRIDFLYDKENETLYFNEINNIPGSLAYYLFEKKGLSFTTLVDMILDEGLKDIEKQLQKITSYSNNILNEERLSNVKLFK